ncbi:hypothetical protein ACFSTE_16475 [Aquimarina hainanensis]|uniref:Uncharacterized protein n=1 Tax=Aquimarina hainanensis TaxID=1578017 RepID=A0ABW5NBK4_9FLAO|nr:hypothetical protein [Aquimarina sp. TRL1]QKX07052.1 hypothetical protein HN014_19750 [Aquimarina sp. TRL1]
MRDKELIIELIRQDLKHNQLVYGLERIGLEGARLHHLEIYDMIHRFMEVPEGLVGNRWGMTYANFMKDAVNYPITPKGDSLTPLAYACYTQLKEVLEESK